MKIILFLNVANIKDIFMMIEISDNVLLKIDTSLKNALYFVKHNIDKFDSYNLDPEYLIDELSDAICRIEDKVRQVKEN